MKFCVIVSATLLLNWGCEHPLGKFTGDGQSYQVTYNPYQNVVWGEWHACLSQHHDHTNGDEQRIRDYDQAGYNAVVAMGYGGVKSLNHTSRERIWPAYRFLHGYENDEAFLETTRHLKFFIPGMEEVGFHHMTSAFLNRYIEKYERVYGGTQHPWAYNSTQECLDLIANFGGEPIIAHPEKPLEFYLKLDDVQHIEIYNAYFRYHHEIGRRQKDMNVHFVQIWDQLLARRSTKIWGYAVNDWHGPFRKEIKLRRPRAYDSGKTLVFIPDWDLSNYRASLEQGAFLSIVDLGPVKGKYPKVSGVTVSRERIEIETDGSEVRWIFCGEEIRSGKTLDLASLPGGLNYIRAEVTNVYGKVYLQPFTLQNSKR